MAPYTVSISCPCLEDILDLQTYLQEKAKGTIEKFMNNPFGNGLNFEKLKGSKDPTMRTIRLDRGYRMAGSLQPDGSFVFLKVGEHDATNKWAQTHVLRTDPRSGALRVVMVTTEEPPAAPATPSAPAAPAAPAAPGPLFARFSDEALMRVLGVEDAQSLAPVRALASTRHLFDQMEEIGRLFGDYAGDKLCDLLDGNSVEDIVATYGCAAKPMTVTEALANPATHDGFLVLTDDEDLRKALEYPLEKWRTFLHPKQLRVATDDFNGPACVTGGAGTGKTVVAMHRARFLAEKFAREGVPAEKKILFTTFSKALASDIRSNLEKICSPEQLARIETVNLDAWAWRLLPRTGRRCSPDYSKSDLCEKLWKKALGSLGKKDREALPAEMDGAKIKREWDQVVLAEGIRSREEYLQASREGCSVPLSAEHRRALWPVFERYREWLLENKLMAVDDMYGAVARLLERDGSIAEGYCSIIVDEAQDFGNQAFRMLGALAKRFASPSNGLFIAGDVRQRIYSRKGDFTRCGIDVTGRSFHLNLNYRTTEETRRWATAVLEGLEPESWGGRTESEESYHSLAVGEEPKVLTPATNEEAQAALCAELEELLATGAEAEGICVAFTEKKLMDEYQAVLKEHGVKSVKLTDKAPQSGGVRLATMHRVKGLEFDFMFLVGLDRGNFFWKLTNPETRMSVRSLIHVAATRARKRLFVVGWKGEGDGRL